MAFPFADGDGTVKGLLQSFNKTFRDNRSQWPAQAVEPVPNDFSGALQEAQAQLQSATSVRVEDPLLRISEELSPELISPSFRKVRLHPAFI